MVEVLKPELPKPKPKGGQPKLSTEEQLLIALEYWREYRTYFHIAQSWGVHESSNYLVLLLPSKFTLRTFLFFLIFVELTWRSPKDPLRGALFFCH